MSRLESVYQAKLIGRIQRLLPDCVIIPTDPQNIQGIPDLLILFKWRWAMLEVKAASNSPIQPNQKYYVEQYNNMSFAAFIYPENEEEVLYALQSSFGVIR